MIGGYQNRNIEASLSAPSTLINNAGLTVCSTTRPGLRGANGTCFSRRTWKTPTQQIEGTPSSRRRSRSCHYRISGPGRFTAVLTGRIRNGIALLDYDLDQAVAWNWPTLAPRFVGTRHVMMAASPRREQQHPRGVRGWQSMSLLPNNLCPTNLERTTNGAT